jgi:hypothetical protein
MKWVLIRNLEGCLIVLSTDYWENYKSDKLAEGWTELLMGDDFHELHQLQELTREELTNVR